MQPIQPGELPATAVFKFLRQRGLILADSVGNELGRVYPKMCAIGILERHPDYPLGRQYALIGILDFYGYHEYHKELKFGDWVFSKELKFGGWIFSIQGARSFPQLKNLARELCQHFQTKIALLLFCTSKEISELGFDRLKELKDELGQVLEPH